MLAVGTSACQPPPRPLAPLPDASYFQRKHDHLAATFEGEIWFPVCQQSPNPDRCGLIWPELASSGRAAAYVTDVCHEDVAKVASVACLEGLRVFVLDLFRRRYSRATQEDVMARCAAGSPELCDNMGYLEVLWIASHNAGIANARAAAMTSSTKKCRELCWSNCEGTMPPPKTRETRLGDGPPCERSPTA